MRKILSLLAFACPAIASFSQVPSARMFRDNNVVSISPDLVFDTKAWQFNAGSPVRATPLIYQQTIYFGTAAGDFFAIDKKTAKIKWQFKAGQAIHSSAAGADGKIYFSDNSQTVYCLNSTHGKLAWQFRLGEKMDYPWRYDYYYSSPVLQGDKLFIGGDDGFFYALQATTGKLLWKFRAKGIIRSTAAIAGNKIIFGDTEAALYALDITSGKEFWRFAINGDTMRNDDWGFDRRAINASPVVKGDKVIVGARDGYLYCVDLNTGKKIWTVDHAVSWVISTVAVKDSFVVTGTSDGRFVQAVHLTTGREIWKFRTPLAVWSSPLIINDKVYAGTFDGQLYCIDLLSGKRVSQFKANGKILSSPVYDEGLVYVGVDDGYLYALSGHADQRQYKDNLDRYVFYETGGNVYFRAGADMVIRNYLRGNGYKVIGSDSLAHWMSVSTGRPSVIVFASCYFPSSITQNAANSILRRYLDAGGRVVLTGNNPLLYQVDEKTKQPFAFRPGAPDSILGIDYGKGDTRTFMGDIPSFPTEKGRQMGLPEFWSTSVFIDERKADIVLGKNENGKASAFVKNYLKGGQFVQLWTDADRPDRLDAIIKAAEWKLE